LSCKADLECNRDFSTIDLLASRSRYLSSQLRVRISAMPVVGQILSTLLSVLIAALFGLVGRWIQLHPERIVPKGQFVGRDSSGARLFRAQVILVGSFTVFGGTFVVVSSLLSLLTFAPESCRCSLD